MSRRSFLAGGGAPASFQHGQGGRYAAFSCQGLIHRFRRYLYTVATIAKTLGVSRASIYRHLTGDTN
jgi:predicted transcriptional regulator